MFSSFSANHMTAGPRGVPYHGKSTAFSLRILSCSSVIEKKKEKCYTDLTVKSSASTYGVILVSILMNAQRRIHTCIL